MCLILEILRYFGTVDWLSWINLDNIHDAVVKFGIVGNYIIYVPNLEKTKSFSTLYYDIDILQRVDIYFYAKSIITR